MVREAMAELYRYLPYVFAGRYRDLFEILRRDGLGETSEFGDTYRRIIRYLLAAFAVLLVVQYASASR